MASLFRQVPVKKPRRNVFKMPHEVKLTTEFGRLTPFFCEPVVPGDTWSINTSLLMRLAPMIAPVMHRCNWYVHFFFVPNRLLWSHWEEFITGGEDGTSAPEYPLFSIPSGTSGIGKYCLSSTLYDYLGFPTTGDGGAPWTNTDNVVVDALPFKAYHLIWNEYYRDQNLQNEVDIHFDDDGTKLINTANQALLELHNRCWEKDYFTSALPWTQRGPEVRLPMTGDADIDATDDLNVELEKGTDVNPNGKTWKIVGSNGGPSHSSDDIGGDGNGNLDQAGVLVALDPNGSLKIPMSEIAKLKANLTDVSSATINELRRCIALQKWMEANARGGSRYIEQIWSHFGVRSSDARLQRPEFLGGGKGSIMFENIPQTSSSDTESPQGNYSGNGTGGGSSRNFKKWFEEYGFIIGILSVMPKPSYQQGMPRKYLKRDKFDFYYPEFANLGEQEIQQQEVFFFNDVEDTNTFGYTPRYAEYKYIPNSVHGAFRNTLDFWHMGRIFNSVPYLNGSFIEMKAEDVSRVWAVEDGDYDHLWVQMLVDTRAVRPMPKFGVPLI